MVKDDKTRELKHILAVLNDLCPEQLGAKNEYDIVETITRNPLFETQLDANSELVIFLIIIYHVFWKRWGAHYMIWDAFRYVLYASPELQRLWFYILSRCWLVETLVHTETDTLLFVCIKITLVMISILLPF